MSDREHSESFRRMYKHIELEKLQQNAKFINTEAVCQVVLCRTLKHRKYLRTLDCKIVNMSIK